MAIKLTDAEQDVLVKLVECGGQRDLMAQRLNIKPPTLKHHLVNIRRKTGTHNSVQLVRWALREAHRGKGALRIAAIVGPSRVGRFA